MPIHLARLQDEYFGRLPDVTRRAERVSFGIPGTERRLGSRYDARLQWPPLTHDTEGNPAGNFKSTGWTSWRGVSGHAVGGEDPRSGVAIFASLLAFCDRSHRR